MFIVHGIPRKLKSLFSTVQHFFEKRQWRHFYALVLAFALAYGRRTIRQLLKFLGDKVPRQRRHDFLIHSPWRDARVLQEFAREPLRRLGAKAGDDLELILDFTHIPKSGKTTEATHRYFDPVSKTYRTGHSVLLAAIRYRGVLIPWVVRLWVPKSFVRSPRGRELGLQFKNSSELSAEIIREFPRDLAATFRVCVIFDSGLLNRTVVSACDDMGFHFVSMAKSNRVFRPFANSKKRNVSEYGRGVLRESGKPVTLPGIRGETTFRVASRTGSMNRMGPVQAVFSRRLSDGSFATLVTDDLEAEPTEIVSRYRDRWPIEVALKELKQHLGLGQYQTTRYEGILHHLHLCLISYTLLVTLGLQGSRSRNTKRGAIKLPSVPDLQGRLRALVSEDNLQRLSRRKSRRSVLTALRRILMLP